MKIWISGTIAKDIIMDFPGRFADHIDPQKIHILNLSFAADNLKENYGGTAANICYNLAMLGEKPEIVGSIGKNGLEIKKYLENLGVETKNLKVSNSLTTSGAYIITDREDNQITGFHAGAMNDTMQLPRAQRGDWAIIAADNPRHMAKLGTFYQKKKINYIFDPGQAITALTNTQLKTGVKGAKVLIGNDYEIGNIMSRLPLRRNDIIIVKTLGSKGSEILAGGRKIRVGIAKPAKVVDPTGAGDAYRAGFLKGLLLGYNIKSCGQLGATVASFAVERYGTQNHKFSLRTINKRFKENFKR